MRTNTIGAGVAVLAVLVAGWLLGLAAQRSLIEATTYADITPPLMLLGLALCALGGAATRLLAPERRVRTGAAAGMATLIAMLAGYGALIALYWDRYFAAHQGESGETPVSVLLEAWFWVGVPVLVSATLGAVGWLVTDRLAGHTGGRTATGSPTI